MTDEINEVQFVIDEKTGAIAQLTYPSGIYDRMKVETELTKTLQRLEND